MLRRRNGREKNTVIDIIIIIIIIIISIIIVVVTVIIIKTPTMTMSVASHWSLVVSVSMTQTYAPNKLVSGIIQHALFSLRT